MAREDFLKSLDARDFEPKEEIDGVIVVHTGMMIKVPKSYRIKYSWKGGGQDDLEYEKQEVLKMYDSNGNPFYSNCSSLKEAEQLVKKLKAEGKNAVIGPKAPTRGPNGKPIPNPNEGWVGVYIVKAIEEKEESKDGIEPAK